MGLIDAITSIIKLPYKTTVMAFSIVWFSIKLSYTITVLTPLVLYISWVSLTGFLIIASQDKQLTENIANIYDDRRIRIFLGVALAFVSEIPHYLFWIKLAAMWTARFWFVFSSSWIGWLTMIVDIGFLGACWYLYYLNFQSIFDLIVQTPTTKADDPIYLNRRLAYKSLLLIHLPKKVSIYKCVAYFGPETLRQNVINRLSLHEEGLLDIYTTEHAFGSKRPVLLYMHGGSWTMGSKDQPNPLVRVMAERGVIVVNTNYRLANRFPMPAGFMDVKNVVIWIRKNIEAYGGDPNFIIAAGDSAGAHLAQLLANTPNMEKFQPDSKETDTTIRGTILISPVLDILNKFKLPRGEKRPEWFRRTICGNADYEVVESLDPLTHLTPKMPPCLAFHGVNDTLVDINQSIQYHAKATKLGVNMTLVKMENTNHAHMIFNSPRTIAEAHMAADWALDLWFRNRDL